MSTTYELVLPWPPSINHYYINTGRRLVLSAAGREYRDAVAVALSLVFAGTLEGAVRMEVDLFPPDRRRRDMDNVQKALWDTLQHAGAYRDDAQIKSFACEMRDVEPGGKVVVRLWERSEP